MSNVDNTNKFTFVSPEEYSIMNGRHLQMNTDILQEYKDDVAQEAGDQPMQIIDFGCGTGETAKVMASNKVFSPRRVGNVTGLDLSPHMVDYCNRVHGNDINLSFEKFDMLDEKDKAALKDKFQGQIDLLTSFSTMHWVPKQIEAFEFFKSLLNPTSGKMVLFVCISHQKDHVAQVIFERVKAKFPNMMKNIQYRHDNFRYMDSELWQSTDKGVILANDYKELIRKCGFEVLKFEEIPAHYHGQKPHLRKDIEHKIVPYYQADFDGTENFKAFKKSMLEELELQLSGDCEFHDVKFNNLKILAKPKTQ